MKTFNRRTLDFFNARAYFYLSLAYERCGRPAPKGAEGRHERRGSATPCLFFLGIWMFNLQLFGKRVYVFDTTKKLLDFGQGAATLHYMCLTGQLEPEVEHPTVQNLGWRANPSPANGP